MNSKKIIEVAPTQRDTKEFPDKLDLTHVSVTEVKVDIKSSLATSINEKVTLYMKDENGTINNEMGLSLSYTLVK